MKKERIFSSLKIKVYLAGMQNSDFMAGKKGFHYQNTGLSHDEPQYFSCVRRGGKEEARLSLPPDPPLGKFCLSLEKSRRTPIQQLGGCNMQKIART